MPLRILITGFAAFPGAPYNPTPALVARLLKLRRPALSEVELIGHVFPVTYAAVDAQLPALIARHRPDALLMFGLAARTPFVRIETLARNAISTRWPDADHSYVTKGAITPATGALPFGPQTRALWQAARGAGLNARLSRNAGSYLCNYLCWRSIEATRNADGPKLAAFIHVPVIPRGIAMRRKSAPARVTFKQLVDAGEAMLMEMVKAVRRTSR